MSLFDYEVSKQLASGDPPFYALIMAAMRRADSENLECLRKAFPSVWIELITRYKLPGGVIPGEQPSTLTITEG